MHAIRHILVGRRVHIAKKQAVEIVRAVGTGLGDQRQVRRHCAVVAGAGLVVVPVRIRNDVGRACRTHEHLALVVRTVHHLVFGGNGLDLGLVIAKVSQVAERDIVETVTARTDFPVDLEAPLQGGLVEIAEGAGEAPFTGLQLDVAATRRHGG